MGEVVLPVPSLTGGVTQQDAYIANPDRLQDSLNMVPLPSTGLARRSGSEYIAEVHANVAPESRLVEINLGGKDRYLAVVSHKEIKVFLRNGTEVPVKAVTRDAAGAITGGAAADFSYLDLRTMAPEVSGASGGPALVDAESIRSSGGAWTIGSSAQNTVLAGPASPLGWPTSALPDTAIFSELVVTAGAGNFGTWIQSVTGYLWSGIRKFSVYVNTALTSGNVNADKIGLSLTDPTDGTKHEVVWDWGGVYTAAPTVTTNTGNFIVFATPVYGTTVYRLGFIFDPDKVAAPTPGNTIQCEIKLDDVNAGTDSSIYAWGALLEFEGAPRELGRYAQPPEVLRTVPAGDVIFIANPQIPTRLDTTVLSTTLQGVYGTRQFDGVGAGANETSVQIADAGYLFVKEAGAAVLYGCDVILEDTTGAGGTVTIPWSFTPLATDGTDVIALDFATTINAHALNTDGGTGGNEATIVECTALGSVVKIETKLKDGETWTIKELRHTDGIGDGAMSGFTDKVDSFSEVPLVCQDDHQLLLTPIGEARSDFQIATQVIRFVGDSSGEFGAGHWVEGTRYGVRTTLDPTTLPHVLTRREDNNVGTVTGEARALYFEWAPHTWDARAVGGDAEDPGPSFVTPEADEELIDRTVTGISFYQNRLILTSGLTLSASESNVYGNFWRTTLKAFVSSDRIDVVASTPDASRITDVFDASGRIFMRSDRSILGVLGGEFNVRTVGLTSVFGDGTGSLAQGTIANGGVFVPTEADREGGVTFLLPTSVDSDSEFVSIDATAEVPNLIKKDVATLVWAPAVRSLFVHTREDPTKLFGFRFLFNGTSLQQSAWYPLDFGGRIIHSVAVIAGDLFVLVNRDDDLHLEVVSLDRFQKDPDEEWKIHLDRRVSDLDLNTPMTFAASETTITLPYIPDTGVDVIVTERSGTAMGVKKTVNSVTGAVIKVAGDVTALDLYIGQTFESKARPLRPVLRQQEVGGGFYPRMSASVNAKSGFVALADTAYCKAVVIAPDGTEASSLLDTETSAAVVITDETLRFGVISSDRNTLVEFRNDTHKPMNIVGMEWILDAEELAERVAF